MLDAKWLEVLTLPLKVMLGIALSSGALLILDFTGMLDLDVFGPTESPIMRPIVIVLCVVSSILSLVSIIDVLLEPKRERQRQLGADVLSGK